MINPYKNLTELCEWLRQNSSGDYRASAYAASVIEDLNAELTSLRQYKAEAESQPIVGYLVRGNFFYSKEQAERSADHITQYRENCIADPLYIRPVPAGSCAVPEGYVLAPIEPSPEMLDRAAENLYGRSRQSAIDIAKEEKFNSYVDDACITWNSMLSAIPSNSKGEK